MHLLPGVCKITKELARTRGYVQIEFSPPVLEHLTTVLRADTYPNDGVHLLFSLAQTPAGLTSLAEWRIAGAFLGVDQKLAAIPGAEPSCNWPLRLNELFTAHCEHSPNLAKDVVWVHTRFLSSINHTRHILTITDPELKREVVKKMHRRSTFGRLARFGCLRMSERSKLDHSLLPLPAIQICCDIP